MDKLKIREVFKFDSIFRIIPAVKDLKKLPEWKKGEIIEYLQNPLIILESSSDPRHDPVLYSQRFALSILEGEKKEQEPRIAIRGIDSGGHGHIPLSALLDGKWKAGDYTPILHYKVLGRYNDIEQNPKDVFPDLIEKLTAEQ